MTALRFCPVCLDEGTKSNITAHGGWRTLLGGGGASWDENGVAHYHDPNYGTFTYSCSLGHWWSEKSLPQCPSCDYAGLPTITIQEDPFA